MQLSLLLGVNPTRIRNRVNCILPNTTKWLIKHNVVDSEIDVVDDVGNKIRLNGDKIILSAGRYYFEFNKRGTEMSINVHAESV